MKKRRTLSEWIKDKKIYIKEEKEGLKITGIAILFVAGSLYIASFGNFGKDDEELVLANKPKDTKENYNDYDNYDDDMNISFEDTQSIKVVKFTNKDNKNDMNILFIQNEADEEYDEYDKEVTDILDDVIISRYIAKDKYYDHIDNKVDSEFLGYLTDYLIVNDYVKQNYTKEELKEFKNIIKEKEASNNKKLTK